MILRTQRLCVGWALAVASALTLAVQHVAGQEQIADHAANGQADIEAFQNGTPTKARRVAGRAQGVALDDGKGRVVVMGEAAMFSAQVIRFTDAGGRASEMKMGMNVPDNDNRQFLLNIMRWLTRHDGV